MIDKSVTYMPVMMIKRDMNAYPRFMTPEGYRLEFYKPESGRADWVKVQLSSRQIDDETGADRLFASEFMDRPQALSERMLFARDYRGEPVATATIWYGHPFGEEMMRLHWVATDEGHQGKGLCRALLTRLLDQYHALSGRGGAYLISQTFSYPAIQIYQDFGFTRYMGPEPEGFRVVNFEETARAAWKLIDEKLAARRFLKK